jgi:flagellar biogenesis protein FliO
MKRLLKLIAVLGLVLAAAAALTRVMSVARDIRRQSIVDEVQTADVILVLGAAAS